MRRYSFFSILLLCVVIVGVDLAAFYWLQSITSLSGSLIFQRIIDVLFFVFMIGLVSAILFLKLRMDSISEKRRQRLISSIYGLTVSSLVPKIIFVIIISILYFSNYMFSESQSKYVVPLVGLFSGFVPFFVILYAVFKSVYHFRIYKVSISILELPAAFEGLRIIQLSDAHLGSFNRKYHLLEKAFKKINSLQPDVIVFTGDIVNNYAWELDGWDRVFNLLDASLGKYAVLGNHDYGDYSKWDTEEAKQENFKKITSFYDKTGFTLLCNSAILLRKGQETLALIGVENWGAPPFKQYGDLAQALNPVRNISCKLLLSHDPTHWHEEVLRKTDIALTLAGHTHGSQAGFQYRGRSWSPIQYKYAYWAGLYTIDNQHLYVNRGLGWLGFPGRVGMRPEITCIDLINK